MDSIHFLKYGKPGGTPLIVLHGIPGSAKHGFIFKDCADKFGVEVYSVDRPGYGHTLPTNQKGFEGWVPLFEKFLKEQELNNFSIIGISGGAPYATAIASALSPRVERLGIICGLAPWNHYSSAFSTLQNVGLNFFRRFPDFLVNPLLQRSFMSEDFENSLDRLAKSLNIADQNVLAIPEVRKVMIEGMIEARRQGLDGIRNDLYQYSRPWPVEWGRIQMPSYLWHGLDDLLLLSLIHI